MLACPVPKGPLGLYPLSAAIPPFIPVCEYCYMTDKYYIPYYSIQDSYRTEEQIKEDTTRTITLPMLLHESCSLPPQ